MAPVDAFSRGSPTQGTSRRSVSPTGGSGSFRGRFRQSGAGRLANLPRKVLSWRLDVAMALAAPDMAGGVGKDLGHVIGRRG
jgi:hypothetical protein